MLNMPGYADMERENVLNRSRSRTYKKDINELSSNLKNTNKKSADYYRIENSMNQRMNLKSQTDKKIIDRNNAMAKARREALNRQAARLTAAKASAPTTSRPSSGASNTAYRPQATATGGVRQSTGYSSTAQRRV